MTAPLAPLPLPPPPLLLLLLQDWKLERDWKHWPCCYGKTP